MAEHKTLVAQRIFDDLKSGEVKSILIDDRYPYAELEEQEMPQNEDILEIITEDGETLRAVITSTYEGLMGCGHMYNLDVALNEHIYTVEGLPMVSVNDLYKKKHFGFIQGIKDRYKTIVWKKFGQTRIYYNCDVEYTFVFTAGERIYDPTNCFGMVKIIEDIIVVDDSGGHIRSNKVAVRRAGDNEKGMVIIKIIY